MTICENYTREIVFETSRVLSNDTASKSSEANGLVMKLIFRSETNVLCRAAELFDVRFHAYGQFGFIECVLNKLRSKCVD